MDQQIHIYFKQRLDNFWEPPNLALFFEKAIKRSPHLIRKRTLLFSEGDPLDRLYFIREGFAKAYRLTEDGKEMTCYLLGPNYVLGIRSLLSKDESELYTAESMTNLSVVTMSKKEYFNSIAEHPELLIDLVHLFADRLTYTERKLEGFIFSSTTARVANFFLDIVHRFCSDKETPIVLPLRLTHQQISEFIGSFRETITLALQNLENDKTIEIDKKTISIINLPQLYKHALLGKKKKQT